jgi:post-segregation antitoxin (ccd killing protein)
MVAKRILTSVRVDEELWRKAKIHAIENRLTLTELVETALSKELSKDQDISTRTNTAKRGEK